MMNRYTIAVTVSLRGPILSRSTTSGDHGVDAVFFRDSQDRLAVPGTLVKGKIREAWETLREWAPNELPTEEEVTDWLGQRTADSNNEQDDLHDWEPQRGRAKFPEAFVFGEKEGSPLNVRIQIEPESGAAADGMLLVEERPFASGESAEFKGTIAFWGEKKQATTFRVALERGINSLIGLGGNQGVGYGRIDVVTCDEPEAATASSGLLSASPCASLTLGLRTNEPVCITEHRPAGNIFKSLEQIPGGVLKGAIARQMEYLGGRAKFPALFASLDQIRIRYAQPRMVGERAPRQQPLSIVSAGNDWHDVVHCSQPILIDGQAPRFVVDWKDRDFERAEPQFGGLQLDRQLTVRTAINRTKRRAEDEKLFAYESVLPSAGGRAVEWITTIDFPAHVPDSARNQLKEVLSYGLEGVGKTKAYFSVASAEPWTIPQIHLKPTLAITLVTPTLLGDPDGLTGKSDNESLRQFYTKAWEELCPALQLSHYFAQQQLAGGTYLWKRFQKGKSPYKPWLLTKAGSIFVFSFDGTQADVVRTALLSWLQTGLPHVAAEMNWQNCPFVRENGYGEIAVNLHQQWEGKCRQPGNCIVG